MLSTCARGSLAAVTFPEVLREMIYISVYIQTKRFGLSNTDTHLRSAAENALLENEQTMGSMLVGAAFAGASADGSGVDV